LSQRECRWNFIFSCPLTAKRESGLMTSVGELTHEVAAEETCCTGDGNAHSELLGADNYRASFCRYHSERTGRP
jgi:hypothetical protein